MLNMKIPKNKVTKIKPVLALKVNGRYESMVEVKARVGCTYIVNGGTYNMATYALDSGLMIDKKILKHGVHGFGLKDEKTLEFNYDGNNNVKDYFGAYGDIIRDGKHAVYLKDENKRGRTGIGITDDSIVLVSIGDKENKYKCSSAVFMDTYFKGCDFAINLDGGGSSQWITPSNRYISGRLVAWYLCIWVDTISTAKVNGPEKVIKVPAPAPKGTPVSYITHTVAHGETLGSIARKYGTSYQKIAKDNNIKNVNLIHEGQKLKIYRGVK